MIGPSIALAAASLDGLRPSAARSASSPTATCTRPPSRGSSGRAGAPSRATAPSRGSRCPASARWPARSPSPATRTSELVDAGALESVGAGFLAITDNARLVLFEAAQLARAGAVRVANNATLPDDIARALEAKKAEP